ncbi:hypothetical protein T07_14 [Trichinella nelsoni]|uniref:Uncharacterized protein n=1 Tax=Trichinella nelsoni TaxID=6336 RepID=A0A0V0S7S4_9BILA|nr:hypothetical protein T07_14 [Trichinella nelsoni]
MPNGHIVDGYFSWNAEEILQKHLGLTSTPLHRKTDYKLKSVASPAVVPDIRKLDTAVNYVGAVLHTARPQNLS